MKTITLQRNFTRVHSNPMQPPRAILFINDESFAGVCAWCSDKKEADAWCLAQGLVATHSICPTCRARFQEENNLGNHRQVA